MKRYAFLAGILAVCGCFPPLLDTDKPTSLVHNNPFGAEPPPAASTRASYAPAGEETARRVDKVGKDLIEANKQIPVRPLFGTIGVQEIEVFHVGMNMVYVTEGLVKQCKTNAELAAVLSAELAKMVAEREAHLSPELRNPDRMPPIRLPQGNNVGSDGNMTAMAELAKFEASNRRTSAQAPARIDPMKLASGYLEKAGFQTTDLEAVGPILQAAEKNVALERHFKGAAPQSPWAP